MSDHLHYETIEDLPRTIPVFPLSGALLLPRGRLPLNIFEPRYLTMVDDALGRHRLIGMVQPRRENDPATRPELYELGCVGRLTSFSETYDGRYTITLNGICRFKITGELDTVTPYRQTSVDFSTYAADLQPAPDEDDVDRPALLSVLRSYLEKFGLEADWTTIEQAPVETLVNSLAMICPFEAGEKQALLEAESLLSRSKALIALFEMASASNDDDDDLPVQ